MKRILITGSNGLLGQKLIYSLLEIQKKKNIQIIATGKGANRLNRKEGYFYERLDITDKPEVRKIFAKYSPDAVINAAAMTNVDACETQREECWNNNVIAVKNICETLHANSQLIHLSTDFVFDGENGPYREDAQPNPLHYYALSKYESEKTVQKCDSPWTIIRTIIIYGVTDNMSRSNIVLWAKNSLTEKKTIRVVNDQFRAPTLAEDLAQGCIAAALKKATGIFHVSGKDIMSILDMVYTIADFWKLDKGLVTPVSSEELNQPAKRPPRTGFILDKAIKELDYKPHSFLEGLKIVDKQLKVSSN